MGIGPRPRSRTKRPALPCPPPPVIRRGRGRGGALIGRTLAASEPLVARWAPRSHCFRTGAHLPPDVPRPARLARPSETMALPCSSGETSAPNCATAAPTTLTRGDPGGSEATCPRLLSSTRGAGAMRWIRAFDAPVRCSRAMSHAQRQPDQARTDRDPRVTLTWQAYDTDRIQRSNSTRAPRGQVRRSPPRAVHRPSTQPSTVVGMTGTIFVLGHQMWYQPHARTPYILCFAP